MGSEQRKCGDESNREIRRSESWWRSKCQRNRDDDMGKRRKVKLTSEKQKYGAGASCGQP